MRVSERKQHRQLGLDVGSSLVKMATGDGQGGIRCQLFRSASMSDLLHKVQQAGAVNVGLTGGGAARLASELDGSVQVNEFTAWGKGAGRLLSGGDDAYVLVSLGTGTSVMLVEGDSVTRLGGTALGGGTVLGLGSALLGSADFEEICRLAATGSRDSVDLLVRDIYPQEDSPLNGNLTAASFGRAAGARPPVQDQAAALLRLVGENVTLIAGGHANRLGLKKLVFGGSTLRHNPVLAEVLHEVSGLLGLQAVLLPHGEFAGALGALPHAEGEIVAEKSNEERDGTA